MVQTTSKFKEHIQRIGQLKIRLAGFGESNTKLKDQKLKEIDTLYVEFANFIRSEPLKNILDYYIS